MHHVLKALVFRLAIHLTHIPEVSERERDSESAVVRMNSMTHPLPPAHRSLAYYSTHCAQISMQYILQNILLQIEGMRLTSPPAGVSVAPPTKRQKDQCAHHPSIIFNTI